MENDPYEIWREAVDEIERQQLLDEYEAAEFNGPLAPGQLDHYLATHAAHGLARAFEELYGDTMDIENENEKDRFIRAILLLRTITFAIMTFVLILLTVALIADWIDIGDFVAASIIWFGLGTLFVWGTDIARKEKEDAKKENTETD